MSLRPRHAPALRLALVVPGAASLGAYEAGALTALLRLVRASHGLLAIDTVVGASAGSIAGALLTHALVTGTGDDHLEQLWVDEASIANLLEHEKTAGRVHAPLSTERLEAWAEQTLRAQPDGEATGDAVAFVACLTNLGGLRFTIAQPEQARVVAADTHRDARSFLFDGQTSWADVTSALVEATVASAAHPLAFAPRRITRRREEYPPSVELPGASVDVWYTDGGTVANEPLNLAIDAVYNPRDVGLPPRAYGTEPRLFLLVQPHAAPTPTPWPGGGRTPSFREAALRAAVLSHRQSVYDDLRRLERTNSRIAARDHLRTALEQLVATGGPRAEVTLRQAAAYIGERRDRVRALRGEGEHEREAWLDVLLDEVSGTAGKRPIRVDVVSPALDPSGRPADELLAGDPLGSFFGFALKRARESDFGLGYRHARAWWEGFRAEPDDGDRADGRLSLLDLPEHPLERKRPQGSLSPRDVVLPRRAWLAARLAARYARAVVGR